jgi:myosin heavy subunit
MDTLTATAPHYVRCLKPNVLKMPAVFDSDLVLNQLRYAGMMETIKIRFLLPSLPYFTSGAYAIRHSP